MTQAAIQFYDLAIYVASQVLYACGNVEYMRAREIYFYLWL